MIAHFEIHVDDMPKAKAFYGGLFDWSFEPMIGGEQVDYHLANSNHSSQGNGLTLGLLKRIDETPKPGSPIRGGTMTFEVADCDGRYAWALANGGAEALPPTDFPGVGRCAYVEDGQGNVVGMVTPSEEI